MTLYLFEIVYLYKNSRWIYVDSLAISPKEQIHFLNKLVANTLPVRLDAQKKT